MPKKHRLDTRPAYMKELMKDTSFMGYRVTESGVVFNRFGKLIKPKFYMKGKRIDYVYIDVTYNGIKRRISYHRFIYMAWHPDFEDIPTNVIVPIGRRFDYGVKNLKCISQQEHLQALAKNQIHFSAKDWELIRETYKEVSDMVSQKDFAKRLGITPQTLRKYLKGVTE